MDMIFKSIEEFESAIGFLLQERLASCVGHPVNDESIVTITPDVRLAIREVFAEVMATATFAFDVIPDPVESDPERDDLRLRIFGSPDTRN